MEEASPSVDEASLRACVDAVWSVDLATLVGTFARIAGHAPGPDDVEAASWACVERGRELTALDLEAAASTVNRESRRWGAFLDEHDLFVCPTTPAAAPSGTPAQDDPRFATAEGWMDDLFGRIPFTPIGNVTGQPSVSLPLGQDDHGVPLGVMLTAQTLREDLLLRVAADLERALPW